MNQVAQRLEVIGGGLAGLALGTALRRDGVPVTLFEAGSYPRQRVCGEFMTGLDDATVSRLDLLPHLAGAIQHERVAWFRRGRLMFRQKLPQPAWAISRWVLDERLARTFTNTGGHLVAETRVNPVPQPGRINATGRRRSDSPWMGLKMHVRGLELAEGLEVHLGRSAYVGACRLPGGEANVCGLFHRQSHAFRSRRDLMIASMEACDLGALAERIRATVTCDDSEAAVAGLGFGGNAPAETEIVLGDAGYTLPPFLGNGMAAAFQMAAEAVDPLTRWSRGDLNWATTCAEVHARLRQRFRRRIVVGSFLHRILLSPPSQGWLAGLARAHCLPTQMLYRVLH